MMCRLPWTGKTGFFRWPLVGCVCNCRRVCWRQQHGQMSSSEGVAANPIWHAEWYLPMHILHSSRLSVETWMSAIGILEMEGWMAGKSTSGKYTHFVWNIWRRLWWRGQWTRHSMKMAATLWTKHWMLYFGRWQFFRWSQTLVPHRYRWLCGAAFWLVSLAANTEIVVCFVCLRIAFRTNPIVRSGSHDARCWCMCDAFARYAFWSNTRDADACISQNSAEMAPCPVWWVRHCRWSNRRFRKYLRTTTTMRTTILWLDSIRP